jgi:hypothetical protein
MALRGVLIVLLALFAILLLLFLGHVRYIITALLLSLIPCYVLTERMVASLIFLLLRNVTLAPAVHIASKVEFPENVRLVIFAEADKPLLLLLNQFRISLMLRQH